MTWKSAVESQEPDEKLGPCDFLDQTLSLAPRCLYMQRSPSITVKAMATASSVSAPVLNYSYTIRQPERYIRYIKTYDEAQKQARLSASALQGPFLGFDVEWRPSFVKNAPPSRVALIQLASKHEVLLFQISQARKSTISSEVHYHALSNLWTWPLGQLPPALRDLLLDTNTKKVGVGITSMSPSACLIHTHFSPPSIESRYSKTPTRLEHRSARGCRPLRRCMGTG